MKKRKIQSKEAPEAIGPYSHGIVMENILYLSGQIGINPKAARLVEGGLIEEVKQVFANISSILQEAGTGFENVVKTTVFLTDIKNFNIVNEIYAKYFREPYPARVAVGVAALPLDAEIMIDVVAGL